ncbi:hypothetical protein FJW07_29595 [Mesorhizobium sp. B3-1-9]|nr:hypothetical protein FJW07_29595 [Mesorhizobium sp. B3-1-9]TPI35769.1 hypothetical protein FJ414_17030 [Mesorhizobium sp. B3-1-6]TPI60018.1 hypothetical protein FJ417_14510 [Mesorhizobium sp. B3-1-7]TPI62592.1 hypothetical protein FJ424_20735 [Mesorhizobium sp. B3-1-8]TPI72275.1 hypothetical protein FJ420_13040 [Mesorhizobium sp. B3-1-3]TPJ34479.1 hypothetical protein FJ418_10625 [Mesorhizobium sp. B2-8-3]
MTIQKEDYRTNRADYAIASMQGQSAAFDARHERRESKKSLWLRDRRLARLAENPCETVPGSRARRRGN